MAEMRLAGNGGMVAEQQRPVQQECLEPEVVASYLDGRLSASQRESVDVHLAGCEDCRELVTGMFRVNSALDEDGITADEGPFVDGAETAAPDSTRERHTLFVPWQRWTLAIGGSTLALAAATLLIVRLDSARVRDVSGGLRGTSAELQELVTAVGTNRDTEARLTGGFAWAPVRSTLRSPTIKSPLPPGLRIAIAKIQKVAEADPTPEHLHALGIAQLIDGREDDAIGTLRGAADARPEQARIWSDLAAAYLTRVKFRKANDDSSNALASAERAVALDASLAEAWFNLALARQAAGQTSSARDAWRRAAALDQDSLWRAEAARRAAP